MQTVQIINVTLQFRPTFCLETLSYWNFRYNFSLRFVYSPISNIAYSLQIRDKRRLNYVKLLQSGVIVILSGASLLYFTLKAFYS